MSRVMCGPSFDGSGEIVERTVPDSDVHAFRAAGYNDGVLDDYVRAEEPLMTTDGATANLPTEDPLIEGDLWNDAGTVKVSAGPPP